MTAETSRRDFPALRDRPEGSPVYLDSACMTLVPEPVLRAMHEYYTEYPGCAGRSLHRFAERVGERYEAARGTFARFLGRSDARGVVFLRNATEALNLVAQGLPWEKGDRVIISDQEHNSNLVVWQRLAEERGIRLEAIALPDDGSFDGDALNDLLARRVRLVSLFHTSNVDGRSLPLDEITERAHDRGALVMFDGCQAASHRAVDADRVGVDYYAVSAHKMLGPTGTGVLAAAVEPLERLRPLLVGGETVERTTLERYTLRPPPHRFEAGLQNYAGVIGAAAAVDYLAAVGREEVEVRQRDANRTISEALAQHDRVHLLGPADAGRRPSIYGFTLDGIDPNDAAVFLDEGHRVMVRSGMHCAHSYYARRGLVGNVRASFHLYTTRADAEAERIEQQLLSIQRRAAERKGTEAPSSSSPPMYR